MSRNNYFYEMALNILDDEFSSNQFANTLKELNAPKNAVSNQAEFLHNNCIQGNTRRTWLKKKQSTSFSSPHIIKDAKKMTVTVVPKGKEKKYITSKIAEPQQYKKFSLLWGLLTFNY